MAKDIILDTDIGTDVDDALALATILGSPELNLLGVTTVHADVRLRARVAQRLLQLAGRDDIPVYAGSEASLTGRRALYWEGHEGQGLVDDALDLPSLPEAHAATFIAETIRQRPGEVHLLAVGPLTNIALALHLEPRLFELAASVTIMGGAVRATVADLSLPVAEHNIKLDPEAAHLVFARSTAIRVVPLDITTTIRVRGDLVEGMLGADHPFTRAVGDQLRRYPPFARRGWTNPHDPLAVLVLADPDLIPLTPLRIGILADGTAHDGAMLVTTPSEEHPANAHAALAVDIPAVEEALRSRLLTPPSGRSSGHG